MNMTLEQKKSAIDKVHAEFQTKLSELFSDYKKKCKAIVQKAEERKLAKLREKLQ
jgi:hypothetical protein